MLSTFFTSATLSAAAIGVALAMWSKVRSTLYRVYSLAVIDDKVTGEAGGAFRAFVAGAFKRTPFRSRLYGGMSEFIRSRKRQEVFAWEEFSEEPTIFWRGWRPLMVSFKPEMLNGNHGPATYRCSFSYLRGTFDSDELIRSAIEFYNNRVQNAPTKINRFEIRRVVGRARGRSSYDNSYESKSLSGGAVPSSGSGSNMVSVKSGEFRVFTHGIEDIGPLVPEGKAIDDLSLPPHVLRAVRDVERWLKSEEWFLKRGLIWTRGMTAYGGPGNGKTRTIRAIAVDNGLPIFLYDLASLSNEELISAWSEMQRYTPCIALMEDTDGVFHGRINIRDKDGQGVTFDCLLNCLGGVDQTHGVYKIVTTNDISKLDPALGVPTGEGEMSTRPGRLDIAIEFKNPEEAGRLRIANRLLDQNPELIPEIVAAGINDSGAQFVFRCSELATKKYWDRIDQEAAAAGDESQMDPNTGNGPHPLMQGSGVAKMKDLPVSERLKGSFTLGKMLIRLVTTNQKSASGLIGWTDPSPDLRLAPASQP